MDLFALPHDLQSLLFETMPAEIAERVSSTSKYCRKRVPRLLKKVTVNHWSPNRVLLSRLRNAEDLSIDCHMETSCAHKWRKRLTKIFSRCHNVRRLALKIALPNYEYTRQTLLSLPSSVEDLTVQDWIYQTEAEGKELMQLLSVRLPNLRRLRMAYFSGVSGLDLFKRLERLNRLEIQTSTAYLTPSMDQVEILKEALPKGVGPNLIGCGNTIFSNALASNPFDIAFARQLIAAGLDPNLDLGEGIRPIARCETKESMKFMIEEVGADCCSAMGSFSSATVILANATFEAAREFMNSSKVFSEDSGARFYLERTMAELPRLPSIRWELPDRVIKVLTDPSVIEKHRLDLAGARDDDGNSLLHIALEMGCMKDPLNALLACGIDPDAKNNSGEHATDLMLRTVFPTVAAEVLGPVCRAPLPLSQLGSMCRAGFWGFVSNIIENADTDALRDELCRPLNPAGTESCLSAIFGAWWAINIDFLLKKINWIPRSFPGCGELTTKLPDVSIAAAIVVLRSGVPFSLESLYHLFERHSVASFLPQVIEMIDFRNLDDTPLLSYGENDYGPLTVISWEFQDIILHVLKNLETSGYNAEIVKRVLAFSAPENSCFGRLMVKAQDFYRNDTQLRRLTLNASAYLAMHRKYFGDQATQDLARSLRESSSCTLPSFLDSTLEMSSSEGFDWLGLVPEPGNYDFGLPLCSK
eukprot:TRINITY_DN3619_c0_g1_i1.p1 TRINITY_DN3619_c0_g1~~TRINITY_DN3619_c0_g1_i1.p1  ORF type:complete len:700 (-),score=63.63 TRINITY_DN3619_c0_g1_i1:630-2729(-)